MHFVVLPKSFVLFAITPGKMSISLNCVIFELAFVEAAIRESHYAVTFFGASNEISFVLCSIHPFFMPIPMLLIIGPLSRVRSTILSEEHSFTLHSAIYPIAFIYFTIIEYLATCSIRIIALPVAFEDGSISTQLPSHSFLLFLPPLTVVDSIILDSRFFPVVG